MRWDRLFFRLNFSECHPTKYSEISVGTDIAPKRQGPVPSCESLIHLSGKAASARPFDHVIALCGIIQNIEGVGCDISHGAGKRVPDMAFGFFQRLDMRKEFANRVPYLLLG